MIENRPDWCVSRQRAWGVPITVFICEKCDSVHMDKATMNHIYDQFAAHGALQKLGDSYANVQDTDDAVQTLDELIDRLYDGKWAVERQPGEAKAAAGGSSLVKALMEISGKSKEEITTFLSAKTPAEKNAMKLSAKVAPVYQRFEAERLAKSGKVEAGESQLAELGI